MSITYNGIEWTYDNLSGIGYDSAKMLEPYGRWFYLITEALNQESESVAFIGDDDSYKSAKSSKESIIKLKEYDNRKNIYHLSDNFSVVDRSNKIAIKTLSENITLSERSLRNVIRSTKDDVSYLLDECRYIQYDESTQIEYIVDQNELSGSIPLFDFELNDSTWNESDFNKWTENNCPVNYNEVRPFIPGEYEYTKAYAGFRLDIPTFSGDFGVANSTVYIDVEDTVEKGTTEASVGELTRVEFSKTFYTSPHIITSLNYAYENAFVEVPVVTKNYFEFGIKSTSTGEYVAGEINWLADGY